jgi:hypothetical protein
MDALFFIFYISLRYFQLWFQYFFKDELAVTGTLAIRREKYFNLRIKKQILKLLYVKITLYII